jgi:hypothetical protein
LAIGIDQADKRRLRAEPICGKARDDIDLGIGRGVEHAKRMQRSQPRGFINQWRGKGWIKGQHGSSGLE